MIKYFKLPSNKHRITNELSNFQNDSKIYLLEQNKKLLIRLNRSHWTSWFVSKVKKKSNSKKSCWFNKCDHLKMRIVQLMKIDFWKLWIDSHTFGAHTIRNQMRNREFTNLHSKLLKNGNYFLEHIRSLWYDLDINWKEIFWKKNHQFKFNKTFTQFRTFWYKSISFKQY